MALDEFQKKQIELQVEANALQERLIAAQERNADLLAAMASPPQGDRGEFKAQLAAWATENRSPRTWLGIGWAVVGGPNPRAGEKYYVGFANYRAPVVVRGQERLTGALAGKIRITHCECSDPREFGELCRSYIAKHQFGGQLDALRSSYGGEANAIALSQQIAKVVQHSVYTHLRVQLINFYVAKTLDDCPGLTIETWEEERPAPPPEAATSPEPVRAEPPKPALASAPGPVAAPPDPRYAAPAPKPAASRGASRRNDIDTLGGPSSGGRERGPGPNEWRDTPPKAGET